MYQNICLIILGNLQIAEEADQLVLAKASEAVKWLV